MVPLSYDELRPCDQCGKTIVPQAYRVTVEAHSIDMRTLGPQISLASVLRNRLTGAGRLESSEFSTPIAATTYILCPKCFEKLGLEVKIDGSTEPPRH